MQLMFHQILTCTQHIGSFVERVTSLFWKLRMYQQSIRSVCWGIFFATLKCIFLRDSDHLECDTASWGRWFPLFQRNMWHSFLRFNVHGPFFRILNTWWWRWYIPFKSWEPPPQFLCICAIGHHQSNILYNSSLIIVLVSHLMSSTL
jgi:hypothetical protein